MTPTIKVVLIDDDPAHIQKFMREAQLPAQVQLHPILAVKAEGAEPFPEVMAYLTDPRNGIHLIFCDIRLDDSRESDMVGVELVARLEQYYKGRIPFGIAFITGFESVYSANMLVEMISPVTLCGFAVKWQMYEPPRSFKDMVERILHNFRQKFIYRLNGGDGLSDPDQSGNYTWFFKGYLDDYLNSTYRMFTKDGRPFKLSLRQIVAFERIPNENNLQNTLLYYIEIGADGNVSLKKTQLEHTFEEICTALTDLDFRPRQPKEALQAGERGAFVFEQRFDQPVVFARVASKVLINLQQDIWDTATIVYRNGKPENAHGRGTWLVSHLRLDDNLPLQFETHRECDWGRVFLEKWFGRMT